MQPNDVVAVARELCRGRGEAHWRAAVGRAYYASLYGGDRLLTREGFTRRPGEGLHDFVKRRLMSPTNPDLNRATQLLGSLAMSRNQADYTPSAAVMYRTSSHAQHRTAEAADFLALLAAVDADPARRSAAVADIRSRYP